MSRPAAIRVHPTMAASFLANRHRQLHEEMVRRLRALSSAASEKRVHQARIAVRRVLALMRLFRSSSPPVLTHRYRRTLKALMRSLGPCRNLELLHQGVRKMAIESKGRSRDGLESLGAGLANAHASACLDLQFDLHHWFRTGRLKAPAADEWLRGDHDAESLVAPTVRRWRGKLKRMMKPSETRPKALHRIRAKVKDLRYALDLLAGVTVVQAKEMGAYGRLQDRLGELQDLHQLRHALFQDRKNLTSRKLIRKLKAREKALLADYRAARKALLKVWKSV